jgi:hypothetical protein
MQKSKQTNWQISSHGLVGEGLINRLQSIRGFAKFQVKGGSGLRGGKLPAVFYTPAVYHDQFESDVLLLHHDPDPDHFGLDLNPISVSYGLSNRLKVEFGK